MLGRGARTVPVLYRSLPSRDRTRGLISRELDRCG